MPLEIVRRFFNGKKLNFWNSLRSDCFLNIINLFLLIFLLAPAIEAQTNIDGLIIQADSGERNLKNHSTELTGNIQIIYKDQHLSADRAIIYQDRKEFEAEGHILLVTPKANLGGEKIVMNYETNKGTIYSGFIQSGQVIFEGAIIEKTDEDQYITTQSQFTSCTTCPAAWSFSGQTIEAQIGGYALIKNSILRIATFPVLWLPYLILPLKSERQTGLLTPSFEYSRKGGLSVAQPFFWAISKSQDATFTAQSYATRGLKSLVNYRYILSKESSGELDSSFIRDRYFGHGSRYTRFEPEASSVNRWFLHYKHYWTLPNNWIQRTEINRASDFQHPNDFPFETMSLGDPALENRFSLTKNDESHHFSIDSSYYINLLKGNPIADNRDTVHRLPEINLSNTRQALGNTGFLFNYELRYTNFARNDFAYDDLTVETDPVSGKVINRQVTNTCNNTTPNWENDPNCRRLRDGKFDTGTDLLRSGQRLIFEPTLIRPMQLGENFNLTPKLSYRQSHYSFGVSDVDNLTRRFLRAEVKLQTSFSRIYGDLEDPNSNRYKHEMQPEILSTSVPWLDEPTHPFLGFTRSSEIPFFSREAASNADLYGDNGLQFDYDDRLYDRNLITYRLTNKITRKIKNDGAQAAYDRLLTWRLSQTYDVYEGQRGTGRQPWSDIESLLNLKLKYFNVYTKINFFPYQRLSNTSSNITFNDDLGDYLKIGLIRSYTPKPNGDFDVSGRTEDYLFQIGTTAKYVNFAGRVIYNGNNQSASAAGTRIKEVTYALIFRPPGNCWGIHFLQHNEAGTDDPTYKLHFDFLFDGKVSLQSPTKLLEAYGL